MEGGVMITVDATQDVGWGWVRVMITFPELANLVDATQDVWGGGSWGHDHVP